MNVVPFPTVPAAPTGFTYNGSGLPIPWSVADVGLVMMIPFCVGPAAMTDVPPTVTTDAVPATGVTAISANHLQRDIVIIWDGIFECAFDFP